MNLPPVVTAGPVNDRSFRCSYRLLCRERERERVTQPKRTIVWFAAYFKKIVRLVPELVKIHFSKYP